MELENLHVGKSGDQYCLSWKFKADGYHVWLDSKTYKVKSGWNGNRERALYKTVPGEQAVRMLSIMVPKNKLMIADAIAEATAQHLFEKCDQELAAAEQKQLAKAEEQRKLKLVMRAGPEMLEALQLCKRAMFSGYQDELSENRRGIYTGAFEAADSAIRAATEVDFPPLEVRRASVEFNHNNRAAGGAK